MLHMQFALICPAVFEEKMFANNVIYLYIDQGRDRQPPEVQFFIST